MGTRERKRGFGRSAMPPVVAALCLLGVPSGTGAQEAAEGHVEGIVVEAEGGRPVAGAALHLEPGSPSTPDGGAARPQPQSTVTGADGRYRFSRVAPGWYRLDVHALGYQEASLWIELPASWRIERSLGLEIAPVQLEAVEVGILRAAAAWAVETTPSRRVSAGTSTFGADGRRPTLDARALGPEDVRGVASFGEPDVLRALQHLPGASAQGDYSAGLWTRGAPWGLTQVMLDGFPLYHPLHLGGTASGVSADGLEAVVFLPGARPAAFSDGAAGVVNLVTRRADEGLSMTTGLSPYALLLQGQSRWAQDRVGLSISARRSWWDLVPPPRLFTGDSESGRVDYWFGDVVGRFDLRLAEWALLEAGGLWEQDRVDGDIGNLIASSEGRWGNHVGWVALGATHGGVRARLTVGRTDHSTLTRWKPWQSFFTRDRVQTLDPVDLSVARAMARLELGGGGPGTLTWEAGVDRARETLSQFGSDALDREAPGLDEEAVVGWSRVWAQGTGRVGPALLSAGFAWDAPVEGDAPGLGPLPNATLRVDVTDRLTVETALGTGRQFTYPFARAGRMFGPALGVDHVWMMAGGERSPLTSEVRTLGAELRLDHGFGATATAWRRTIEGLALDGVATVVEGALVPTFELGTEGTERGRGWELVAWRRSGRVRGEISYSRGRTRIEAPGGMSWAPPSDRRYAFDVVVSAYLLPTLRLGSTFRSESGWPYAMGPWICPDANDLDAPPCERLTVDERPPHSIERAPGYETLDVILDWSRPGDKITWGVSASLKNVLGRDNKTAFRPEGCPGAELISVACESPVGRGVLGDGLTSPTPALAIRVLF